MWEAHRLSSSPPVITSELTWGISPSCLPYWTVWPCFCKPFGKPGGTSAVWQASWYVWPLGQHTGQFICPPLPAMPAQLPDGLHLSFLEPIVHYIRAIFSAENSSSRAAACSRALSYLSSCLHDNRVTAQALKQERLSLLQQCLAPVHYARFCRILCARQPLCSRPHHLLIQEINAALQVLDSEENLIVAWQGVLALVPPPAAVAHRPLQVQSRSPRGDTPSLPQVQIGLAADISQPLPPYMHNAQ